MIRRNAKTFLIMSDVLATLDSVRKVFPHSNKPALERVSAVLRAREVTGLVGPDGAGQKALGPKMAGVLGPTSRPLSIEGEGPDSRGDQLPGFHGCHPEKVRPVGSFFRPADAA